MMMIHKIRAYAWQLFAQVLIVCMPMPALASGFYLSPWAEALLFLLFTPAGWAVLAAGVVAMLGGIVALVRRKRGRR